jgi:hypothetical protein
MKNLEEAKPAILLKTGNFFTEIPFFSFFSFPGFLPHPVNSRPGGQDYFVGASGAALCEAL